MSTSTMTTMFGAHTRETRRRTARAREREIHARGRTSSRASRVACVDDCGRHHASCIIIIIIIVIIERGKIHRGWRPKT